MREYWWVIALIILAGVFVFTKPNDNQILDEIKQSAAAVFDDARVSGNSTIEKGFRRVTCSVARADCERQVKKEYRTSIDDYIVLKVVNVSFRNAKVAKCFGIANSVICGG